MTSSGRRTRPSRATNRCTRSMNGHLAPFRRRPEPFQLTSANPRHASSGWGETPLVIDNVWTADDVYAFSDVLDPRGALLVTTRNAGLVRAMGAAEVEV